MGKTVSPRCQSPWPSGWCGQHCGSLTAAESALGSRNPDGRSGGLRPEPTEAGQWLFPTWSSGPCKDTCQGRREAGTDSPELLRGLLMETESGCPTPLVKVCGPPDQSLGHPTSWTHPVSGPLLSPHERRTGIHWCRSAHVWSRTLLSSHPLCCLATELVLIHVHRRVPGPRGQHTSRSRVNRRGLCPSAVLLGVPEAGWAWVSPWSPTPPLPSNIFRR